LHGRQLRGAAENARKSRLARIRWQDEGRDRARNGDPLFAAGCMPYWGEGRKTRNAAQITNSDPEVLRFFVAFLRRNFDVEDEHFAVACHLFADHRPEQTQIERVWLETLELPDTCLRKSMVN